MRYGIRIKTDNAGTFDVHDDLGHLIAFDDANEAATYATAKFEDANWSLTELIGRADHEKRRR